MLSDHKHQISGSKSDNLQETFTKEGLLYEAKADDEAAMACYAEGIEAGEVSAEHKLAILYQRKGDLKLAIKHYSQSAQKGFASSQVVLADFYFNGSPFLKKNFVQAVHWYSKAAMQENALAQSRLGYCYSQGRGVEKNDLQASQWCIKAALQGNRESQLHLSCLYLEGKIVPHNVNNALFWVQQSLSHSPYPPAELILGKFHQYGWGIPADPIQALKLFQDASKRSPTEPFFRKNYLELATVLVNSTKPHELFNSNNLRYIYNQQCISTLNAPGGSEDSLNIQFKVTEKGIASTEWINEQSTKLTDYLVKLHLQLRQNVKKKKSDIDEKSLDELRMVLTKLDTTATLNEVLQKSTLFIQDVISTASQDIIFKNPKLTAYYYYLLLVLVQFYTISEALHAATLLEAEKNRGYRSLAHPDFKQYYEITKTDPSTNGFFKTSYKMLADFCEKAQTWNEEDSFNAIFRYINFFQDFDLAASFLELLVRKCTLAQQIEIDKLAAPQADRLKDNIITNVFIEEIEFDEEIKKLAIQHATNFISAIMQKKITADFCIQGNEASERALEIILEERYKISAAKSLVADKASDEKLKATALDTKQTSSSMSEESKDAKTINNSNTKIKFKEVMFKLMFIKPTSEDQKKSEMLTRLKYEYAKQLTREEIATMTQEVIDIAELYHDDVTVPAKLK